jgi:HrpA-like RNA helicase
MDFQKFSKKRKFENPKRNISLLRPAEVDYSLPIFSYKDELIDCIQKYQTTIVIGETGSGKSTQLPQFLSEFYDNQENGKGGKDRNTPSCVVCTQPRRVAAVTIAERVANERNCHLGDEVGYSIRFDDRSGPLTKIKYVTDGVLLREIMTDPSLQKYSVVILDEAHERSLQTDILMGLLKQLQQTKPSLRSFPDFLH